MRLRPNPISPLLRHGASIAVLDAGTVLLVKRAHAPLRGVWSLPGGKLEDGEPPERAALRELLEETGIEATIAGLLDIVEIEAEDADGTEHRYRLSVFYGRKIGGALRAGSDAAEAEWVALSGLDGLPLTQGTAALIRLAAERLGTAPA